MTNNRLTKAMREMRDDQTQEQLARKLNVSRETVSKYESGRSKIPQDIALAMMAKKENPRFAFALRNEYTKTGPVWLDGPNVDLHRSSVREKTLEEMKEAVALLEAFSFARPLDTLPDWEAPRLDELLDEVAHAVTAMEIFMAIVCKEAGRSYVELWSRHHKYLKSKGYVKA